MVRIRYVGVGKNIPASQTNKHTRSVPVLAREVIRVSDIVLEILDARYIDETRNKDMESQILALGKKIIYVINKADLIDVKSLINSGKLKELKPYVLISCKTSLGRTRLRNMIKIEVKRLRKENAMLLKKEANKELIIEGKVKEKIMKIDNRAHIGIIGYPNTGKSSLTNILTGSGAANASSEAGFTKGIQKIRFSKDILILDSPGLIKEGEDYLVNEEDFKKHSKSGVLDFNRMKGPEFIVADLMKENPGIIERFYNVDAKGDPEILLELLGRKLGFLLKGNRANTDKVARRIVKDWQKGLIKANKNY